METVSHDRRVVHSYFDILYCFDIFIKPDILSVGIAYIWYSVLGSVKLQVTVT